MAYSRSPCSRTCGDAEVGLVGGDVVDAVVFAWQDDVPVLQEGDPAWQPKVRVGPLVDLVGEGAEDDQAEDEALPGVLRLQGFCRAGRMGCTQGHWVVTGRGHHQPGPYRLPWGSSLDSPRPPAPANGLRQVQTPLWASVFSSVQWADNGVSG